MNDNPILTQIKKIIACIFGWYAIWTIGCNIITYLELKSVFLIYHFFLCCSIILFLIFFSPLVGKIDAPTSSLYQGQQRYSIQYYLLLLVGFSISVIISLALYKYKVAWYFMFASLIVVLVGFLLCKRVIPVPIPTEKPLPVGSWYPLVLFTLGLLVIYLFNHQVDQDEANYINLAIGAFRTSAGVYQLDTMLGDGPTLIHLPTYKLQSYELLYGTLGYLFPGSVLFYAHIFLPIFFIVLFSFSLYLIYYTLFQSLWLIAALSHVACMFLAIGSFPSYGAHGLLRFFESKAIFINILIPLSIYYTISWSVFKRKFDFAILTLLQISAVGMTANAIYIIPASVGLAALPFFLQGILNKKAWVSLCITLLSCFYPLLLGVLTLLFGTVYPSEAVEPQAQQLSLYIYLGWSFFAVIVVSCVMSVHFFMLDKKQREYVFLYLVGLILLVFNPLLWPIYSYVSGTLPSRIYWAIPFSCFFAIVITNVVFILCSVINNKVKMVNFITACCCVFLCISVFFVQRSKSINIYSSWPGYRVDKENYRIAKTIVSNFKSDNCAVLVPQRVAVNLVMLENHPYPVAVRSLYQIHYRHTMEENERLFRTKLLKSLDEESSVSITSGDVEKAIQLFNLSVILVDYKSKNYHVYNDFLRGNGYESVEADEASVMFYNSCVDNQ